MEYTCKICDTHYFKSPSNNHGFCSHACYAKSRITVPERVCAVCGKVYRPDKNDRPSTFCSRACQAETWKKPKVKVNCEYCGKECEIVPSRIARFRFCSHACRARALSVGKHIGIKAEKRVTRVTPYERPIYRKRAVEIRKRDNYTCQICGKQYEKGGNKLEVDHKIPIRLGGQDTPENLWTLCTSCHRKKDTALRMSERY